MDYSLIDDLQGSRWDDFLAALPGATVFHSSCWGRVLQESYDYRPLYVMGRRDGAPVCALPLMDVRSRLTGRRGVSLPFTDLCPPLLAPGADARELLDFVIDLAKRLSWSSVQLRGWPGMDPPPPPSEMFQHHLLPLVGDHALQCRGYSESTRRNIALAQKYGVRVRMDTSPDGIESFRRLNRMTRRDHGLPPQPPRFFRTLHRHLIAPGHGTVVLAEHGGAPVAGAVFLRWGKTAVFKYGASEQASLPLRPNNLIMDSAIRHLGETGADVLSFGRTEPENEGLSRFKRGWGAGEETVTYLRFATARNSYVADPPRTEGAANRIFRSLPLPALEHIGRLLYRHIA